MKKYFASIKERLFGNEPSPVEEMSALLKAVDEALYAGNGALAEERCGALRTYLETLAAKSTDDETNKVIGAGYFDLGSLYRQMTRVPEAEAAYAKAIEVFTKLNEKPEATQFATSHLAACQNHLGLLYMDCGRAEQATTAFEQAIAMRRELLTKYPDDSQNQVYLGGALCNLAHLAREAGQAERALALYDESIELLEAAIPSCDCGCRDALADAFSQLQGHPHWILIAHDFRRNAEEGRSLVSGDAAP